MATDASLLSPTGTCREEKSQISAWQLGCLFSYCNFTGTVKAKASQHWMPTATAEPEISHRAI